MADKRISDLPTASSVSLTDVLVGDFGTPLTTKKVTLATLAALLGSGAGSVTSVGLSMPSIFTVSGSPITGAGVLTAALAPQAQAQVLASPAAATGTPSFRSLVAGDIPSLPYVTSVGLSLPSIFTVSGSPVTTAGTLSASLASQSQALVLASPAASSGTPSFRALVASDIPALSYAASGANSDITALNASSISLGGGQLKFPATQIPSSDVNTLDDYEEGTWTPTITTDTPGTMSVTYNGRTGTYTKIGRLVFVYANISVNTFSIGTGGTYLYIGGLPFQPAGAGSVGTGTLFTTGISATAAPIRIAAVGGSNFCAMYPYSVSGSEAPVPLTTMAGTSIFTFSLVYQV